ncbi:MAG: DUF721 domain-containing protein [Spirochaetota bacterium]
MKFKFKEERLAKTVSVNSAISLILENLGLHDVLVIEKARKKWRNIVGDLLAVHSLPDRIFKNILFIHVDHPVYSNELSFMKDIILQEVNNVFGSGIIKDIRLETKKLDWQKLYPKNV